MLAEPMLLPAHDLHVPRRSFARRAALAFLLAASASCGGAMAPPSAAPEPAARPAASGESPPEPSAEIRGDIVLEPLDVGPRVVELDAIPIEEKPPAKSEPPKRSPPPPPPSEEVGGVGEAVRPEEAEESRTELGVQTSAGAFDADAVERVVREGLPDVRRCYDRKPTPGETRATVTFTIGRSGRVTGVEVEVEQGASEAKADLRTCVEEVVAAWRFPEPEAPRRVVTPLRFAAGR